MVYHPGQPDEPKPEQPRDEPVTEDEVTPKAEDADDTTPWTVREGVESAKQIGHTAKHGVLKPWYRFARRTIRNAQNATEAFFEGALDDKKGKK